MTEKAINSHTLYTHHARLLQKAKEDIERVKKYLDPDSANYLPGYIANLEALKNSATPPADIDIKLERTKNNLAAYRASKAAAEKVIREHPEKIKALEADNSIFMAPESKRNAYLYVLDDETCKASCMNWSDEAQAGENFMYDENQEALFANQNIELTGEHQTDAVRVWSNNTCIHNVCVTDNRSYNEAHRDAIQLIPPALGFHNEEGQYQRVADQMSGAILENTSIENCTISAPHGPLQGIFSSDGLCRDLNILNNHISTSGSHSISISGLLTGGNISGNTLQEVEGGLTPKISLYPARIGGNIADDGVVSILSFAHEPNDVAMDYAPVTVDKPNKLIKKDGTEHNADIVDMRHYLPDNFLKQAAGIENFRYNAYLRDYSSLTLGEYRKKDPVGCQNMREWLELRTEEYSNGRKKGHPLGQPSSEQVHISENFLMPALVALMESDDDDTRLVDLEYTAIRSFAMKRLAILHSDVAPLDNIGVLNEKRDLTLCFLLTPEQLKNRVNTAYLEGGIIDAKTQKPIPHLAFELNFADQKTYHGQTDEQGRIAMEELPLGPFIMRFKDNLSIMSSGNTSVPMISEAAQTELAQLAKTILIDFSHKELIIEAYLREDQSRIEDCLVLLENYLHATNATPATQVTPGLRHHCLNILGVGSTQREFERKHQTFRVIQS